MKFQRDNQREIDRQTEIEENKDSHIWDEILRKRTMELIGKAA